jgi:hypothetical protein
MKLFRHLTALALAFAMALGSVPAFAQPVTSFSYPGQSNTFRATITALAPAASATDFFTISGVANKAIFVRSLQCDGVSTAAAAAVVKAVKRSALDTTGTSTTPTKVPLNSSYGLAAGAVVKAYTANPGALGAAVGDIAVGELVTGPAASATGNPKLVFDFSNQQVVLNSATENLALNGNGASFSTGAALNCTVEWSE